MAADIHTGDSASEAEGRTERQLAPEMTEGYSCCAARHAAVRTWESDALTERPRLDGAGMHQMSNYLAVILGFIELILADTPEDNPHYADLIEIRNAAVDAAKLIGGGEGQDVIE